MLTADAAAKTKEEQNKATRLELERTIDYGRKAERLSLNAEWVWFKKLIDDSIAETEKSKIGNYDTIISKAVSLEEKAKAIDAVRQINQQIGDFKFLVGLVETWVKAGTDAQNTLDALNKEAN